MSTDTEHHRPSFRFRDKFSRLKDKVKDKLRDKAIKHNVTLLVHQNLTSNDTDDNYSHTTRHGFRQNMHHFKEVLKNKTHYVELKDKIKDKIDDKFDIHDNKTYPKGFYDSLFSPETENDYYLQTALICLWVIALISIIPTIIVIFLPARKKTGVTTSTNMIFFHVFFCELCYLSYVLLAMINAADDFRLKSTLCDYANYGMYVTIPIMQFALLFLSLERLSIRYKLSMTWAKIFTKPYLIQLILCAIWIFLIALLVTFMFIRKQFSFSFIKDQIHHIAPPILGDVVSEVVSRRHHCSIDGRLSSVFKTAIIVLFIILIVKPIAISIGLNIFTPFCCKKKSKDNGKADNRKKQSEQRTTTLVTIFLLLNFFFSFPFYFTSMFKSIFTNIDSTKDTFTIILKICFILRITNIIFECFAFYIFERNSWNLISKLFYYCTCKKFPAFNRQSIDDIPQKKSRNTSETANQTDDDDDDDDDETDKEADYEEPRPSKKKKQVKKKKPEPVTESEPDEEEEEEEEDDDGSFAKKSRKQSKTEKVETQDDDDDDDDDQSPVITRKKPTKHKSVQSDEEETIKITKKKKKPRKEKIQSDEDETEEFTTIKQKFGSEEEEEKTTTTKRKSHRKQQESDNDDDDETKVTTKKKRTSRTIQPDSDNQEEEEEVTTISRRKPRRKVNDEEQEEFIEKPKSKSRHSEVEIRIPNGDSTTRRTSSTKKPSKTTQRHSTSTHNNLQRRTTPIPTQSDDDDDVASDVSQASSKRIKPVRKTSTKNLPSSTEHKRTRTKSPSNQHSRHRTDISPSSRPHSTKKSKHQPTTTHKKKRPKKDRRAKILEMSDDV